MSISPIARALALGYAAPQVLHFLQNAFPSLIPKVKKAQSSGYSVEEILKLLHRGMGGGDDLDNLTESQIHKRRDETQGQFVKDLLKTGAGAAASYGVGQSLPGMIQGARGIFGGGSPPSLPPTPRTPSPQPPIGPQPMAGAPLQPAPVPPVGPQPNQGTPTPTPLSPQPGAPLPSSQPGKNLSPETSIQTLKEMGLEDKIKTLIEAGNNPDAISAGLVASLTDGQKKWFGEKLKAGEVKPFQDMVSDYLSLNPTEKQLPKMEKLVGEYQESVVPENIQAQQIEPVEPQETDNLDKLAQEWDAIEGEEEIPTSPTPPQRPENSDVWEPYFQKSSKNPPKTTKQKIQKVKSEIEKLSRHWGAYTSAENKKEIRETYDDLEKYHNYLKELDEYEVNNKKRKPEKGETVFNEETGKAGELKDIKTKEALVESDGKTEKVKSDELIPASENIIEAAQNLLNIPEVDRSSIISLATYRPKSAQLFIQYHNGETYVYEDVGEDVVKSIGEALGIPVTTGKNMFGAWSEGKQDSRGAVLIHKLLRDPKYAKENEGNTWEKIGTIYDYWKKLRKQPKRKKRQ